jgi:hypothetical protein
MSTGANRRRWLILFGSGRNADENVDCLDRDFCGAVADADAARRALAALFAPVGLIHGYALGGIMSA